MYPSGRKVIKAFIAKDFQFFDVNGQVIIELSDASIGVVDRVHTTWRIQKNRQNNQKITFVQQDQSNDLSRSRCTTSGAQSALLVTTGFNAGGLLPEEGRHGLSYRFQDCVPFSSCGKSRAPEYY